MIDSLTTATGQRVLLSAVAKLFENRHGHVIATLKDGAKVLLQETLEESRKAVDRYRSTSYSMDDNDAGGPGGEQLVDAATGKPIF